MSNNFTDVISFYVSNLEEVLRDNLLIDDDIPIEDLHSDGSPHIYIFLRKTIRKRNSEFNTETIRRELYTGLSLEHIAYKYMIPYNEIIEIKSNKLLSNYDIIPSRYYTITELAKLFTPGIDDATLNTVISTYSNALVHKNLNDSPEVIETISGGRKLYKGSYVYKHINTFILSEERYINGKIFLPLFHVYKHTMHCKNTNVGTLIGSEKKLKVFDAEYDIKILEGSKPNYYISEDDLKDIVKRKRLYSANLSSRRSRHITYDVNDSYKKCFIVFGKILFGDDRFSSAYIKKEDLLLLHKLSRGNAFNTRNDRFNLFIKLLKAKPETMLDDNRIFAPIHMVIIREMLGIKVSCRNKEYRTYKSERNLKANDKISKIAVSIFLKDLQVTFIDNA